MSFLPIDWHRLKQLCKCKFWCILLGDDLDYLEAGFGFYQGCTVIGERWRQGGWLACISEGRRERGTRVKALRAAV